MRWGCTHLVVITADDVPPVVVACFWRQEDFSPEGYRSSLDLLAQHTGANLLMTSLRARDREVTNNAVHAQIKAGASYARKHGMKIAMDLDVRLARKAFQKAHPDELQQMLRLREVDLQATGKASLRIPSTDLNDHYTGATTHYVPLAGRLLRAYAYVRTPDGILPETLRDITQTSCKTVVQDAKAVTVEIACSPKTKGHKACVMAAFTHFAPAVFAPHLDGFQRRIIERYGDTEIVGVCKDEWGFPPCYDGCPAKNDYWYSRYRAAAYAKRTGGRDLLRDCLLMTFGERGRLRERQAAINHFMEMSTLRNAAIEQDFYRTTKKVFGPSAIVATHPTWYPYPGKREFKKNGLDWWMATRDLAQTDEVTPYCARTSLAKKWGSAVWYNMYYSSNVADYRREIWSHALGGGRIDFHPVYPWKGKMPRSEIYKALLRGGIMRGDCRIRLLNFITNAPLHCPVAVIFGHACAMNWAGPTYDDVGLGVADGLWRAGYPADLIPSSEIGDPALKIAKNGSVQYGPQRYRAVVLYHPQFERPTTAAFFHKAASGPTALHCVGTWTRNFEGRDFDGKAALPAKMKGAPDDASVVQQVIAVLRAAGIAAQTPASRTMTRFHRTSCAPPPAGHCRLIDGTQILVSGAKEVTGDPIRKTLQIHDRTVTVDAVGVVGVRLRKDGQLDAMAAGGLKLFDLKGHTGVRIELPERIDVALWRDDQGRMRGVLQGWRGPVPKPLAALTANWVRLALPTPLP